MHFSKSEVALKGFKSEMLTVLAAKRGAARNDEANL